MGIWGVALVMSTVGVLIVLVAIVGFGIWAFVTKKTWAKIVFLGIIALTVVNCALSFMSLFSN